jgi:Holliday junction DNA helicase RuvA
MIASLTGTLVHLGSHDFMIRVAGVGYHVQASSRCLARLGQQGDEVTVLIDTQIRDDRIVLTGFADATVKDTYALLQTVQGVGTKAALSILSALSPDDIILAISAGDKAMITRADGVGPKLAQRIINELADKAAGFSLGQGATLASGDTPPGGSAAKNSAIGEAVSALVNLGYGRAEAHAAVVRIAAESKADSVEALLPLALKEMGR